MTARVVRTVLLREDAGAFWFRVTLADGRVITMTVPKNERGEQMSSTIPGLLENLRAILAEEGPGQNVAARTMVGAILRARDAGALAVLTLNPAQFATLVAGAEVGLDDPPAPFDVNADEVMDLLDDEAARMEGGVSAAAADAYELDRRAIAAAFPPTLPVSREDDPARDERERREHAAAMADARERRS